MRVMVILALLLNIAVLLPVCLGLITNASWARESYGELTPARGILLSVYMAIAFASVGLLFYRAAKLVSVLLLVQVIYKLTTPFTVGTLQNPVVISNLGIAAFHAVTLLMIWKETGKQLDPKGI